MRRKKDSKYMRSFYPQTGSAIGMVFSTENIHLPEETKSDTDTEFSKEFDFKDKLKK